MDIEKLVAEKQWNPVTAVLKVIADGVTAVYRALHEAYRISHTYHSLAQLSDRELADIGLRRQDIGAVAVGGFTRADAADTAEVASFKAAA